MLKEWLAGFILTACNTMWEKIKDLQAELLSKNEAKLKMEKILSLSKKYKTVGCGQATIWAPCLSLSGFWMIKLLITFDNSTIFF